PLETAGTQLVRIDGALSAYRVESYGAMELALDLRGRDGADAYLVVEGPLAGDGDDTIPGRGAVLAQDDDSGDGTDASLHVTLGEPGVYRIIAGTYESLGLGEAPYEATLDLEARCTARCTRPEIPASQLFAQLRASGKLDALLAQADGELARLVPDETLRGRLRAQLDGIVASSDFAGLDRFPTVPLRAIGAVRPALGGLEADAPQADAVTQGELTTLLGPCTANRALPSPVHPTLPEVRYGHFPNRALTACQVAHSQRLAQALTSLAADNGSVVEYRGESIRSADALIAALVRSGHRVEVRNERTYANFLSLAVGSADAKWPVWLDTGIPLADGRNLVVPMGHSHHAWRISGPDVDARVMFYLGVSGTAFFAQTGQRPGWTGDVARDVASTDDGEAALDRILRTLDASGRYLRRNRVERATVAAGMPADGYGFVGVCNDSNATLELATMGTITTFPLMRAAELDAAPRLDDGLDDVVRALPHDGDVAPERTDALRRVLAMTPLDLDSPVMPDELLRSQLREVASEVGD
ncbi:MAG: hypothetical protein IT379_26300, partial [Deltaproteobacteria bacterium]|nr:hypothetical protein [Deltaproteobacteria bacterium]